MADNELNLKINTEADKSKVEELSAAIEKVTENSEQASQMATSAMEDIANSTQTVQVEMDNASESTDEFSATVDNIDGSNVEEVTESVNSESQATDEATESTENLNVTISSIDSTAIAELIEQMNNYTSSTDTANDQTMSLVDAMTSGTASAGISAALMTSASAAGNYRDTMVRLGYALSGTSMSSQEAQQKFGGMISTMTEATGRGAGAARAHLINMGNIGITTEKTLTDSFNGISKAAFQMNQPFDNLESMFQRMALSGMANSRSLSRFGLSLEDLAKVMGVTKEEVSDSFKQMDENTRASVLAMALNTKYGEDVNNNYKNSFEHLTEELSRAKDYFIRTAGEALLPTLIPAIKTAADVTNYLANAFKAIPEPIQNIIGGALGLTGGLTAVGLGVNAVTKFVSSAISPFTSLWRYFTVIPDGQNLTKFRSHVQSLKNSVSGAGSTLINFKNRLLDVASSARVAGMRVLEAGKNALLAGYNALKSAAMWAVEKAQKIASAIASKAAAAAQWLLNIAMSANPIYLVVIAIIALIAVLGYLYFNNEQVRNAINGLGQAFMEIGQIIYNSIIMAIDWIIGALQNLWNYIITLGGLLPANVSITGNQVIDSILRVLAFIATLPIQLSIIFINIIAKALGFGNNFAQRMFSAGMNSVSRFMSQISQLPGRLQAELQNMLSAVGQWAATLPAKFWEAGVNAVKNFLNALGIHSPGIMQTKLIAEMVNTGNRIPEVSSNLIRNIRTVGYNVVDAFGEPTFDISKLKDTLSNNLNNLGGFIGIGKNNEEYSNNESKVSIVYNNEFYIDSVDSEKRIDELIDKFTERLKFDNTTAGRYV